MLDLLIVVFSEKTVSAVVAAAAAAAAAAVVAVVVQGVSLAGFVARVESVKEQEHFGSECLAVN